MLEDETAHLAVRFPASNDKRSHKALHIEILAQFSGVPDLSLFDFQSLTTTRINIDC